MRKVVEYILKLLKGGKKLELAKREASKKFGLKEMITNIQIMNELTQLERKKYSSLLITKPVRTGSGVAPVAIMTKPSQCPHASSVGPCIMCPGGVGSIFGDVPQSYTGREPATMRGLRCNFDSYVQVFTRLEQYIVLGQIPEKIELIIMGGTFTAQPIRYQEEFIKYAFKAMNDFSKMFFSLGEFNYNKFKEFFELPGEVQDAERVKKILNKVLRLKKECKLSLEQKKNELVAVRCVGLVIETRPDYATIKEANNMLRLGCTRVELGIQSIYDTVLSKIRRGHTVKQTIEATKRLRDLGFKITYHYMVGLYGSNPEKDLSGFKRLFSDERFKPDMLKIYPCVLTKGTKLYELYKKGKYKPLTVKKVASLIIKMKKYVPDYVRIMRIQRDIPHTQIVAGPNLTNLRQFVSNKAVCRCIRCREFKGVVKSYKIKVESYIANKNKEYFISAVYNDMLIGFCRLRFPAEYLRKEITKDSALIRELHVYGEAASLGEEGEIQHKGIGKNLLKQAEEIVKKNNKNKIVIISGVGVRTYYRKLGYTLEGPYMVKKI